MIQTSDEFKKAVYAPSRMIKAKVRFEILDTGAFRDNTKVVTSEAVISHTSQLTNKIRKMSSNYTVLEKDYLKLDGSFVLPPHANEMVNSELGWWSNILCDNSGIFTPYQVLEFDFTKEHSSMGLTIYFDILNNEYASDFDIDVFGTSGNTIKHEAITNNTNSRYIYISQLSNYVKITITIKKWCKPYRRAKVVEVDFGIIKEYDGSTLINMNLLQEVDTTSGTVPADEFKFTVDNSSKEFNVLNPKGFYKFLQQGQEVFAEMGAELDNGEVEFIQAGKYFLKEWQSDEGTLTATFTARDILDSLSDTEVENTAVKNTTLYDLAVEVMKASGIEGYVLSDNLKNISTKGLYQKISYRSLLQLIAVAGMCIVYTDNAGTIHMKQLISAKDVMKNVAVTSENIISYKDQMVDNILNPSFNIATFEKDRLKLDSSFKIPQEDMSKYEDGWLSSDLSGSDGTFSTPQAVTLAMSEEHSSTNLQILFDIDNDEYAADFEIQAYDVNNNSLFDINVTGNTKSSYLYQNNLLADSRKIVITIKKWCKSYRRARIIEIGFDLPLDNITLDNMHEEPQITLNEAVKAVEVTYYPNDNLNDTAVYRAVSNDVKEGSTFTVDNSLINTESAAKSVAEWILKENSNIAAFKIDWRQNPALSLTDKVSVETGYGTNSIVNITKQEIKYEGYLSGNTEAKGVI